jgi:hypothetical protein
VYALSFEVPALNYWKVTASAVGIVIVCRGHDKEGTVGAAVRAFHELVGQRPGTFAIVGDLREMTGYESESRVAWQEAFARHGKRIDRLVLVGAQSALIRMGAATIGALTGIPVRFVNTWDEVAGVMRAGDEER